MKKEVEQTGNDLKFKAELLALPVNQSEIFTLREACKYAGESIFEVGGDKWKQPLCGFSPILKNGKPIWKESEILAWAAAINSKEELSKYYSNLLNNSQDSNIPYGVISEMIGQIVKKKLPEYLIEIVDSFVRVKEMISA